MTDKMADNEIVKALECCASNKQDKCDFCPLHRWDKHCKNMTVFVLDLINRLQKSKDFYKKNCDKYQDVVMFLSKQCDKLQEKIDRQKAEIERLSTENEKQKAIIEAINDTLHPLPFSTDFDLAIKTAKTEAYKEFAEEIFELFPADKSVTHITRVTVKHILKELGGDNK